MEDDSNVIFFEKDEKDKGILQEKKSTQSHEIIRQISEDQIFHCVYVLTLHTSKVMLKILQARLQQYMKP